MYLYRYVFFREYLSQHYRRYLGGKVILTDFRDVVFQRNPHVLPSHGLHVSLESSATDRMKADTVKGRPYAAAEHSATAGWMHLCYDDASVIAVYAAAAPSFEPSFSVEIVLLVQVRASVELQWSDLGQRVPRAHVSCSHAARVCCTAGLLSNFEFKTSTL
jgi:hypothetical protein